MKRRKLGSLALILIVGLAMSMATTPIYSAPTESIATLSPEAMEANANLTASELATSAVAGGVAGAVAGGVFTAVIGTPAATAGALVGGLSGAVGGAAGNLVQQLWPFAETAVTTTPAELLD